MPTVDVELGRLLGEELPHQVPGDGGDRVGILADPSAGLGPGPLGQHRPRPDRGSLGRPPTGRSRTWTVRRACSRAWVPQAAHPTVAAMVWTASRHSSSVTSAAVTSKPSRPSSPEAEALGC
jgi:hypothetical protein